MSRQPQSFYRHTLAIALPIMLQNGITNFVSMLDNIMVGRIGTDPMSGVAIIGQLLLVWYLTLFGATAGAGIYTAQFSGKGDEDGVRYTFRLQVVIALVIMAAGVLIFIVFHDPLIRLYLKADGGAGDPAATLSYAKQYLFLMLPGFVPFALTQVYASVLKSTGETAAPMRASLIAVLVNLCGNYVLIYGKFGLPALGVRGAALATILARIVEAVLIVSYTHRNAAKHPFIRGAWSSLRVPRALVRGFLIKGTPLTVNEALWSAGMAALTRNFALRGLSVVAALNIAQTVTNLFDIAFIAMGLATGIIVGQELGKRNFDTVRSTVNRLALLSLILCCISGVILFGLSGVFPLLYNTSDAIRHLATGFIRVFALRLPIQAYMNTAYFTTRAGGRTFITFVFDSGFVWVISVPLSYLLVTYTQLPILTLFFIVQMADIIKTVIGFFLIRSGIWIRDITELG